MPRRLLSVDGIRGSGKTSFIQGLISRCPNAVAYDPPIPRFDKIFCPGPGGSGTEVNWNELEAWWWAFGAKMTTLGATGVRGPASTRVYVVEGSLETSIFLYAQYLHHVGHLSAVRFKRMRDWYHEVRDGFTVQAKNIVLLKTSPVLAFVRLRCRANSDDAGLSLAALHVANIRLSRLYLSGSFTGSWRVVDGNCSTENALAEYSRFMHRMLMEDLPHKSRKAHARVHAAFPSDESSDDSL